MWINHITVYGFRCLVVQFVLNVWINTANTDTPTHTASHTELLIKAESACFDLMFSEEEIRQDTVIVTYTVTITVFIKWQLKKLNKVIFNFRLKSSNRHFLISGSSPLKILLVILQAVMQLPRKCHIYFLKIRSRKWILSGLPFNTELFFLFCLRTASFEGLTADRPIRSDVI